MLLDWYRWASSDWHRWALLDWHRWALLDSLSRSKETTATATAVATATVAVMVRSHIHCNRRNRRMNTWQHQDLCGLLGTTIGLDDQRTNQRSLLVVAMVRLRTECKQRTR